ncbi:MAG TPA: response regulator transcription factor [Kineosporiaceae bacterium]
MRAPIRILVVDDDPNVADVVTAYLRQAGMEVDRAADGVTALTEAARTRPDLVVLDLMLPGLPGLEVCARVRESHPGLPVVMLTALGEASDRIAGLELGADDYLVKPFSPRELVLRVQSVLRRSGALPARDGHLRRLVSGPLSIDVPGRVAVLDGERLSLTGREFDLLVHLVSHAGEAFSRERLMREVWEWDFGDTSTVTVHVRRLREKVEADPGAPKRLVTVWGVGYRWERE